MHLINAQNTHVNLGKWEFTGRKHKMLTSFHVFVDACLECMQSNYIRQLVIVLQILLTIRYNQVPCCQQLILCKLIAESNSEN